MFSAVKGIVDAGAEVLAIQSFRNKSEDLKKIRESAILSKSKDALGLVEEIDKAITFDQLLKTTERYDFQNSNEPIVKSLGRTGMNALFYVGGCFHNQANLAYYLLHFREKLITYMADKGFMPSTNRPR